MRNRILIIFMLFASCKARNPEAKFLDYLNDPKNKITQKIQIGDTYVTAKWMPETNRKMLRNADQNISSDSDNYYYFNVKFERLRGEKPSKEKRMYLAFDIQKDFTLLVNADSIMPATCQQIENGMAGSYEYVIAFENPKKDWKDISLIYRDKIFGVGVLAFVYEEKDVIKIPKLKANRS